MHTPIVTTAAAGLLGLIYLVLSVRIVMGRMSGKVMLGMAGKGENGPSSLFVAIRSHANFAEYVPLCLILIGGLEVRSGATILVRVLAAVLVLARLAHPVGMAMKAPNPFRAGGFVGTVLVLAAAGLAGVAGIF